MLYGGAEINTDNHNLCRYDCTTSTCNGQGKMGTIGQGGQWAESWERAPDVSWLPPITWSYPSATLHNVQFVKYDVTVSFVAQVLDTVAYFVSHVLVVDTVTYFDIFR